MSLIDNFKALFATKAAQSVTSMRHGGSMRGWGTLLKRTRFDYRREVGDCLDSSVVTAPIAWIQRALPEARLMVCQKSAGGEEKHLDDHPMLALIKSPNEFYGDTALWMGTLLSFLIAGNAYWVIVRNSYGRPVELWYIPHWMMEPKWPDDGSVFISHYRYAPGGGALPMDIPFDDVVHFRHGIDPRNMRLGLSPLDGVIREIFIDLESSNFVASLLRNMGVPGVVISPKGGAMPSTDDVAATKTWFEQNFSGDNRGKTVVMGAPTDVQEFGFNPQQLNMSEGRDVAEERVCACLGIPAAIVGFGSGLQQTKVGATMEELRKLAWNNGVLPFARMLADEIQRSLLPQFGNVAGMEVEWDTDDVIALQEDEDKRTERLNKQLSAGAITLYEWRVDMGREADDSHKIYFRPISLIEVPEGQRVVAAPPAAPQPPEAPALPAVKSADGSKAQPSEQAAQRGAAWVRTIGRATAAMQPAFEKRLVDLFTELGAAAEEAALPYMEQDPSLGGPKGMADGEAKDDNLIIAMILDKLGIDQWQANLRQLYEAQYAEVAKAVNAAAEKAGLTTGGTDVVSQSILAAGGKRVGLVDLGQQTRDAVFKSMAEGRAAGEGPVAIAGRIGDMVEAGPSDNPLARSRRIARTETAYAANIATIERAKAAGVTSFIVYDGLLGPGRSLLSHMARNGSIVTAEQALQMAEDEHPNGTLNFAPSFD